MSESIWIIGTHMTPFGKHPGSDPVDLGVAAVRGALGDADVTMRDVEVLAAGTMFGPLNLAQRLQKQVGQTGVPAYNLQNACATGASALRTAILSVKSDEAELALAVGVEKLSDAGLLPTGAPARNGDVFTPAGRDGAVLATEGLLGTGTMPGIFAQAGMEYLGRHDGNVVEHFYKISAKNHAHSALNPLSHHRKAFDVDEIKNATTIAYPNTVLMCSANTDGAAAVVVVSESRLRRLPLAVQERAVRIAASVLRTDPWTPAVDTFPDVNTCTREAAQLAYEQAGIGPEDLDLIELHDCFATAELLHYDNLGLCEPGGAGAFLDSGAPYRDGRLPINVSGGLQSKGHPIGATGIANVYEVTTHLRGEAGDRQIDAAKVGLTHVLGLGSTCAVHVLERAGKSS